MTAYERTTCPSCGAELDPLPPTKEACPAGATAIHVRPGWDGLVYFLREADLEAFEQRWATS